MDELLKRLNRYTRQCLTERTDPDFADAIFEAAEELTVQSDVIELLRKTKAEKHNELLKVSKELKDCREELQKPKWIPVTERLPEQNTRVIGFMAWKGITAIEYQHGKWYSTDHLQPLPNEAVTHWMPLPQAPKEE